MRSDDGMYFDVYDYRDGTLGRLLLKAGMGIWRNAFYSNIFLRRAFLWGMEAAWVSRGF
jgi:hypothetical protein